MTDFCYSILLFGSTKKHKHFLLAIYDQCQSVFILQNVIFFFGNHKLPLYRPPRFSTLRVEEDSKADYLRFIAWNTGSSNETTKNKSKDDTESKEDLEKKACQEAAIHSNSSKIHPCRKTPPHNSRFIHVSFTFHSWSAGQVK